MRWWVAWAVLWMTAWGIAEPASEPIRPGSPGEQFFWNEYSSRFIYPPAFYIKADPSPVHQRYRYTLRAAGMDERWTFEARVPYAPLTPLWDELPTGQTTLTVESLTATGSVVRVVGERTFFKAPSYNGPYGPADTPYAKSARKALMFQYNQPHYRHWRRGEPGYYHYGCYPSKTFGSAVRGMVTLAKHTEDAQVRREARAAAVFVADLLLDMAFPGGTPFAGLVPTYDDEHRVAQNSDWWDDRAKGRLMLTEPVDSASSLLDLYEFTGDARYREAVWRMMRTYRRTQLPSGTWPLRVLHATGTPDAANRMIPARLILLLDRLIEDYEAEEFVEMRDRAVAWIETHPMRNFHWEGQFEDIPRCAPYLNLSHYAAVDYARYLLRHRKERPGNVERARELLRFAEDQFIIWEPPTLRWSNAMTPCALEQYWCYRPINASAAHIIHGFIEAYEAIGDALYLEKARSLANTQVAAADPETGQYRTFWYSDGTNKGNNWDNCAIDTALALLRLSEVEGDEPSLRP
ncbi:hypothetical protein L21SP4_01786 [Kiritimatiella glycovorans]|uniref:Uncharacterized protein n=2 Tax=Kiritimatiella glycovorans TaxID=1307763 RepID=A0A0G3EFB0_9BACT|nr:hypothetical protein L21SP4_01786 [Kiritimatiella glycovorans]